MMNKDNYDIYRHLARAPKTNGALDLLTGLQDRERGRGSNRENIGLFAEEQLVRKTEMKETRCEMPGMPRSTFLMVFSPDCTIAASTHGNHNISVTDLRSGKNIKTLVGHPRTPWCIAFHPTSNQIVASGCLGGQVRIWDLSGGSEVWTTPIQSVIASLAFHPNDRVLVIATCNQVFFWDWNQPEPFAHAATSHAKENVRYVAFDKLGHKLITGIANSPMTRWERVRAPVPVPRQESCASSYRRRITQRLVSSTASRTPPEPEPEPEPEEPPTDGNSVVPERERRITRCYRNLVREYERLVQRYLQLYRPPTMIDRGTDPMEPSHLNNGTQTANRSNDDAVAGPSGLQRPSTSHSSQNLITPSRMFLVGRKPPSSIRGTQTKESRKHKANSKEANLKNEKRMRRDDDSSDDDDDDDDSSLDDRKKLVVVLERLPLESQQENASGSQQATSGSSQGDSNSGSIADAIQGLSTIASELPGSQFDNVVPPGRPGSSGYNERFNRYISANKERIQEFRRKNLRARKTMIPPQRVAHQRVPYNTPQNTPAPTVSSQAREREPETGSNLEEDHQRNFVQLVDRIRQTAEEEVRSRILPIIQSVPQPDRAEILRLFENSRENVRRRFSQMYPRVLRRGTRRSSTPRVDGSTDNNNSSSSDAEPSEPTTPPPRSPPYDPSSPQYSPTMPPFEPPPHLYEPTSPDSLPSPPPLEPIRFERDYHEELEQLVTSLLNNIDSNDESGVNDPYPVPPAQSTSARTRPNRGVSWLREAENEIYSRRLAATNMIMDQAAAFDIMQQIPSSLEENAPPMLETWVEQGPPDASPMRRAFFHRASAFMPTRVNYSRSRSMRRLPHYGSGRSGTPRTPGTPSLFLDEIIDYAARERESAARARAMETAARLARARETAERDRETARATAARIRQTMERELAARVRETLERELAARSRETNQIDPDARARETIERARELVARERECISRAIQNATREREFSPPSTESDILPPLEPLLPPLEPVSPSNPNPDSGSSTIGSIYSNIVQDLESSLNDVMNIRRAGSRSGETAGILSSFSDRLDNIMTQSNTILRQLRTTMDRLPSGYHEPWSGIPLEFADNIPENLRPVASDHTYPRDPWNSLNELHPALNSLHLTITHIQKQARLLRRQVQSIERVDRAMLEVTQLQVMRQLVMEMVRHFRTLSGDVQPAAGMSSVRQMMAGTRISDSGPRQAQEDGGARRRTQSRTSSSTTSNIDLPGTSTGGPTQPRRSSNRKTYPPSRFVGFLRQQHQSQPQTPRRAHLVRCLTRFERCIMQMQQTRSGAAPPSFRSGHSNPHLFNYSQITSTTLTSMTTRLERLLTEQMRIFTRAPDAPPLPTARNAVDLAEHIMSLRLHGCVLRMTRVLGNSIESSLLRNANAPGRENAATQDGAARYGARHTLSLILDGMSRYIEELGNNGISNSMRMQINGVLAMALLLTELLLLQVVDSVPPPSRHGLDPEREALARRIDEVCTAMLQTRMPVRSAQLTRSLRLMRLTMRHANRALDQTYVTRRNAMLPRPDTDRRQLLGTINRCLRHINRTQSDSQPDVGGQNQATPPQTSNASEQDQSESVLNTMNELLARYSSSYQEMSSSNEAAASTVEGAQTTSRESAAPTYNDNTDEEAEDASAPGWFYYRNRNNNGRQSSPLYRTHHVNLAPRNVPSIQVNAGPVPEPESFSQRLMSHRQIFAERVSELRSNQAARGLFRPRFLHPLYASVNPFDSDLDDPQREQMYDSDVITTVTPNHRIQAWDISNWTVPSISNSIKNVIVSECRIHNDASVDIATDGTILVTLLPSGGYLNVTNRLGVYSLRWETLGQCLYTTSFEQNAVSVSLSPLSRHLLVGFASRRVSLMPSDRWIMARVYRIDQKDVPGDRLPVLRELEQSRENRINCIRWLPTSGQGLIYATNTGQLVILS
ncbi:unnamed protein product [Ceutorhynchus assimilis]|uniref:Activating molecule in BECN1-regulated autophagy protein 1 n=1 Tax=Ceutorhynchus assimilis TaxID=467358 RepID=A0A9N9QMM1_9CUCU|nr:unnamed protein product [Ceutorhynchus assimilis]